MASRAVHWHEGMFLRPHHMQAAQRHADDLVSLGAKWDLHYNWGLRSIDVDLDALANSRLVVRSLKARLRDGALLRVPEDGSLSHLDLKAPFEQENTLTVYVAAPMFRPGRPNAVGNNNSADGLRYALETLNLEDENTGVNPQPVEVRLFNLKIMLS